MVAMFSIVAREERPRSTLSPPPFRRITAQRSACVFPHPLFTQLTMQMRDSLMSGTDPQFAVLHRLLRSCTSSSNHPSRSQRRTDTQANTIQSDLVRPLTSIHPDAKHVCHPAIFAAPVLILDRV